MLDVFLLFHEVEYPRRSNATRHDLQEMLLIALLSALSGGEGCVDMECFGRAKEGFLRQFLRLEHGIPSHDALTSPPGHGSRHPAARVNFKCDCPEGISDIP